MKIVIDTSNTADRLVQTLKRVKEEKNKVTHCLGRAVACFKTNWRQSHGKP